MTEPPAAPPSRASRLCMLALVCSVGGACGSKGAPPGGKTDSGLRAPADASTPDASESDPPDQDAGEGLAGIDCVIGPDDQAIEPIAPATDRAFALAVSTNQSELVWLTSGCGRASRTARRMSFDTGEPLPDSRVWLGEDACSERRHPALLAYDDPLRRDEPVVVAFYAERDAGRLVPVVHEVSPQPQSHRLRGYAEAYGNARGLSATRLNGRVLLAWVGAAAEEGPDDGRAVLTQLVHFQQKPHILVAREQKHRPTQVAAAEMGGTLGERGAAIAWASHATGAAGGIFLQALDAGGAPRGEPIRLIDAHGASSRVALATHPTQGGALAYVVDFNGASAHVRLQRLDSQGGPTGTVRQITPPSLTARDVSIAAFGQGYVLAYRLLSPVDEIEPVLQLAFTDSNGILVGTLDLTHIEASGGPTSVATANDGRMVVAWSDVAASKARLKIWRGSCR